MSQHQGEGEREGRGEEKREKWWEKAARALKQTRISIRSLYKKHERRQAWKKIKHFRHLLRESPKVAHRYRFETARHGVDGQKGLRLQLNNRLSTLVYHSTHGVSNIRPNIRRIFPVDRLPHGWPTVDSMPCETGEKHTLEGVRMATGEVKTSEKNLLESVERHFAKQQRAHVPEGEAKKFPWERKRLKVDAFHSASYLTLAGGAYTTCH
eukprot:601175-Prorocentrum_minimum.AAC.1